MSTKDLEDYVAFDSALLADWDSALFAEWDKRKADLIEKIVRPPFIANVELRPEPASIRPGEITFIDSPRCGATVSINSACEIASIWFPVTQSDPGDETPPKLDPKSAHKKFRTEQGLDAPTTVTPEDAVAIGKAMRRR